MTVDQRFGMPVTGRNLRPGTLGDQMGPGPTILVFLRHLGCLFCREVVADLRRRSGDPHVPRVVLVHQGDAAEADAFFGSRWPEVAAVSDPRGRLYAAFGVERGSVAQLFGPRAAVCAVRAVAKGNGVGRWTGDVRTLPTALLVVDGAVVWEFRGDHSGDHPDWAALPVPGAAARV